MAAFAGLLLAFGGAYLFILWPIGLAALGLLTLSTAPVPGRLIILGTAVATAFAIWAASVSAGNEYAFLTIAALSAALGIASASARALIEPAPATPVATRDIRER